MTSFSFVYYLLFETLIFYAFLPSVGYFAFLLLHNIQLAFPRSKIYLNTTFMVHTSMLHTSLVELKWSCDRGVGRLLRPGLCCMSLMLSEFREALGDFVTPKNFLEHHYSNLSQKRADVEIIQQRVYPNKYSN